MKRLLLFILLFTLPTAAFAQNATVGNSQIWVDGVLEVGGGGGGLSGDVYASTNTVDFAASASEDVDVTELGSDTIILIRGRLFIRNSDDAPFSAPAEVTFYNHSDRRGEQAIYRAEMSLVCVTLSSPQTAGNNTIVVTDASDFSENDLLYIMGTNPEFGRVEGIVGTTVTLEDNLLYNHSASDGCARVPEFGGFALSDATEDESVWGRIDFGSSQTVDLRMILDYIR
jgi:hypothetical protein